MLILFDIDGTLLLTSRAGIYAMTDAGQELYGPQFTFDGVEFAGRLDPLIWRDVAVLNGVLDPDAEHENFRARYGVHLRRRLTEQPTALALPGVHELVDRLDSTPGITLGLLTGNYPETGRIKLEAAGIDVNRFPIQAWGTDGPTRPDLPGVAMEHYRTAHGLPIESSQVIVIGDTPHDVDCAHKNGCLVIAVATGPGFVRDDLVACDPDLFVEDLSDTDSIVEWILRTLM